MDRRKFIKWQVVSGAALLASNTFKLSRKLWASNRPDLVVVKGNPGQATRSAVEMLGGMSEFVKPGQKVLIKPNMSFDQAPESGTNTHPEVIKALVAMCDQAGAEEVFILDNPLRQAELCLENSKIKETTEKVKACQVEMRENPEDFVNVKINKAEQMTRTEVMKEVLEADVLIAAPTAKHHSSTGVSLSMKGMMGLILNRGVMHSRYDLHTAIIDLCTFLRPDLTVIDANYVLTTNGPSGPGNVEKLGKVVASRDMVAADAKVVSMVRWYGQHISPSQVKHIKQAHLRGLGRMDVESLKVKEIKV